MPKSTLSKAHLLTDLSEAYLTYIRAKAVLAVVEDLRKRKQEGRLIVGSSLVDLRGETNRAKNNLVAIAQTCLKNGVNGNDVMVYLPE